MKVDIQYISISSFDLGVVGDVCVAGIFPLEPPGSVMNSKGAPVYCLDELWRQVSVQEGQSRLIDF